VHFSEREKPCAARVFREMLRARTEAKQPQVADLLPRMGKGVRGAQRTLRLAADMPDVARVT